MYQWDWDYPAPGKMTPATLQQDLKQFHRHGITAINAEASNNWAARGLGYYVVSQLMWDVNADVKEILRDFYEEAFGPAAAAVQRYHVRWHGPSAAVVPDNRRLPAQASLVDKGKFDIEALKAAYQDLDEAVRSVPADSAYRCRIDLLRLYAHYLLLRHRLHLAEQSKDRQIIIDAIREETIFGGRLTETHMIHTRALLGKAFLRRFKNHEALLADILDAQQAGKGWRQTGEPPGREEIEAIWSADKAALGIR